jgi:hypothetical protein
MRRGYIARFFENYYFNALSRRTQLVLFIYKKSRRVYSITFNINCQQFFIYIPYFPIFPSHFS